MEVARIKLTAEENDSIWNSVSDHIMSCGRATVDFDIGNFDVNSLVEALPESFINGIKELNAGTSHSVCLIEGLLFPDSVTEEISDNSRLEDMYYHFGALVVNAVSVISETSVESIEDIYSHARLWHKDAGYDMFSLYCIQGNENFVTKFSLEKDEPEPEASEYDVSLASGDFVVVDNKRLWHKVDVIDENKAVIPRRILQRGLCAGQLQENEGLAV